MFVYDRHVGQGEEAYIYIALPNLFILHQKQNSLTPWILQFNTRFHICVYQLQDELNAATDNNFATGARFKHSLLENVSL